MFDKIWRLAAQKAEAVAGLTFVAGFLLFGFALYLGLNSVQFDGRLKGGTQILQSNGQPLTVVKEVGYFFAPNWLLTGLVLLPLALLYLFRTRLAIEPLITKLIARKMLVRANGEPVDEAAIFAHWNNASRTWSNVASVVFIAAVAFTLVADFIPVVLQWNLASPEQLASIINGEKVTLGHPSYEFDWSIASTFENSTVNGWANVVFAFFAYLFVPLFGSATLFAAMTWIFSTHAMFNANSLSSSGYRLQPDVASEDARLGFELFEDFFSNLVRAMFLTALIVVSMHLQNVYLRSPTYPNILDMVFGDKLTAMIQAIMALDPVALWGSLSNFHVTFTALSTSGQQFSPQTYVAAVALAMLGFVVFGMVWGWLRTGAARGRDEMLGELKGKKTATAKKQRERLEDMKIWPIGWAGLSIVICSIVIVAGCMIWTDFLLLVVGLLLALAVKEVISFIKDSITDATRRQSRRRRNRDEDEDNKDE